ncbi:hypothetical protein [Kitasatospora sp. MBT63]|uniref:hypothetical protein n=1 Tax=Kitasatospora sp. MBT63 TaxID=1444768 RepID=UPI001E3DCD82|nr:hypothetical protein [Kitasatospora sp. MBT63]
MPIARMEVHIMIMKKLHAAGIRSEHAYLAGIASIGLSFTSWMLSAAAEPAGLDRADRWGIFVGEWAPTFFCMGLALSQYERDDNPVYTDDPRLAPAHA